MKKLLFLLFIAIGPFTIFQLSAQEKDLTAKTASKSKGYTVLNPKETIKIYKYEHGSHSPKDTEKYAPKYFFTTESSEVLTELTKDNLKKAFPTKHGFHDALDANFKQDAELTNFDSFHKMYKINRLLMADNK